MIEEFKPFHIRMIEQELRRRKLENPRYSLRAFARYLGIGSSSLSRIIKNAQEISPSSTKTIIKKLKFSEEDSILFLASIAEDKRRKSFTFLSDINADSLLSKSPGLIFVVNRKKQFLYVNEEAAKFYKLSTKEFIGKTFPEIGTNPRESNLMSELIESTFNNKALTKFEDKVQSRWFEKVFVPIMGKDQNVQAVSCHLRDITERKQAEISLSFLAKSGKILSSSFDYNVTLKNVIELIINEMACGCFIHIKNQTNEVHLFQVSHKDQKKQEILERIFKQYPYDPDHPNFYHKVMKSGKFQFNPIVDESLLLKVGRDQKHLSDIRELDAGSYMCIPLITIEKTIGSLTVFRSKDKDPFTDYELELMHELGSRAAWAIDCTMRLVTNK